MPELSVVIPCYNEPELLEQCVASVLGQGFSDVEVILSDDCSRKDTSRVASALGDGRIRWYGHAENLGYPGNLNRALGYASGDVVMLLGQDDLLLPGALKASVKQFEDDSVNVSTRPYYWFQGDPRKPCRAVYPIDRTTSRRVTLNSPYNELFSVFWSSAQLSGLCFRRDAIGIPAHEDIFTSHVWPFLDAMKRGACVAIERFTVAVRIESSMTRSRPDTYAASPIASWARMFDALFDEDQFSWARDCGRRFIGSANTYAGFVQLASVLGPRELVSEVRTLLRLRPGALLEPQFWLFTGLSLLLPSDKLRMLADFYKSSVMAPMVRRRLSQMGVQYDA